MTSFLRKTWKMKKMSLLVSPTLSKAHLVEWPTKQRMYHAFYQPGCIVSLLISVCLSVCLFFPLIFAWLSLCLSIRTFVSQFLPRFKLPPTNKYGSSDINNYKKLCKRVEVIDLSNETILKPSFLVLRWLFQKRSQVTCFPIIIVA